MNTIMFAAYFAAALGLASAHLCLIGPHQRGTMTGLNKKGSDDCILLKGPCGGRPSSTPLAILMSGKNTTVTFQKNLDHWVKASPGYFAVAIMQESKQRIMDYKEIARVPDMGEPSLTLYSVTGMVPSRISGTAVLQVTYVTNNPDAPPVFYQCADVAIN
ncbi:uncharacterized protein LOC123534610 [Mercenaria mercenaria]|uniref:uncharacterized protein LOC123534610 n=1 Tax=Mercenaria mercenaria TaxID=6596 RepID=UPI00234E8AD7|nr:uncharacterized protein LOC123534610 [Mercenaria mercenaria]